MITVLVTSGGGSAALNCIMALREQTEIPIRLISIDSYKYSSGLFLADKGYKVLRADNKGYIDEVLRICENEKVQVLLPTFSSEIPIYASNKEAFNSINTRLILSPIDSITLFENKWLTNQFFLKHKIPTPNTWLLSDSFQPETFPLYLKPVLGSGSRNNHIIYDLDDLDYLRRKNEKFIVQEYVTGQEYTIDILADKESNIIAAVPRERLKVRNGMAIVSRTVKDRTLIPHYEKIIDFAKLVGPINIQYIIKDNQYYFTDVNTRFAAGGLPLTVASGVNIPLMTVKLALEIPIPTVEKYQENIIMTRYYTEVIFEKHSNDLV